MNKLIISSLLLSSAAFADLLSLNLDQSTETTSPGSFVTFSGKLTNNGNGGTFLNGASLTLPYFELNYDLTPFLTLSPPILFSGDSYSGEFFTIAVSSAAALGDYFGSVSIQGGSDSSASDDLATQSFQVTVTDVPEANTAWLLFWSLSLLAAKGVKRFNNQVICQSFTIQNKKPKT